MPLDQEPASANEALARHGPEPFRFRSIVAEQYAYNDLISTGGIPCHVLTGNEFQECPQSDICHFWAYRTDRWTVFGQQFTMWTRFQKGQQNWRHGTEVSFETHRLQMLDTLRHLQVPFARLLGGEQLNRNVLEQSRAMTWLEYFYFTYMDAARAVSTIQKDRWFWHDPWSTLVTSGVLTGAELNRIRRMTGAETVRPFPESTGTLSKKAYRIRMERLGKFALDSRVAREALFDVQRYNVLLLWILQQVYTMRGLDASHARFKVQKTVQPNIPMENWHVIKPIGSQPVSAPRETDQVHQVQAEFSNFKYLPVELRRMIWLHALPEGQTLHHFEVVNQTAPSRFDDWTTRRFGLRATAKHDSGYRTVYPLISSCSEARGFIWRYYQYMRPPTTVPLAHQPDFETFDWIPHQDLIVLRFPPVKGEIPAKDAISIGVGPNNLSRNVAVLISESMVDLQTYGTNGDIFALDIEPTETLSHTRLIASFLKAICKRGSTHSFDPESEIVRGGIRRLFLCLDGWQNADTLSDHQGTEQWTLPSGRALEIQEDISVTTRPVRMSIREMIDTFGDEMISLTQHEWTIGLLKQL